MFQWMRQMHRLEVLEIWLPSGSGCEISAPKLILIMDRCTAGKEKFNVLVSFVFYIGTSYLI